VTIRTFQPGDDAAQVSIHNEAAADLPKFKAATLDEVRRRGRAPEFDPSARFFALHDGRPVAYASFHPSGRVSFPWCRRGHEAHADPLLQQVLDAMKARGIPRAFAAYRADWPAQRDFFLRHGFRDGREMINYVMDFTEMPTPAGRPSGAIGPLVPEDVPAVWTLAPGLFRVRDTDELGRHLLNNPDFPPESSFVLRGRDGGAPAAVGLVVHAPGYADPKQLDAGMPCFRLGAFGTEGLTHKRVNGLFSFAAPDGPNATQAGLDLLAHAAFRMGETDVATFAAQVPSDAAHLVRFYKQFFRRQGSFPLFERDL
jgi:hypothetical protein